MKHQRILKIMKAIQKNPNATQLEIARAVGVSERSVNSAISELKEEGTLERIGRNKDGYWKVKLGYMQDLILRIIQESPHATRRIIARIAGVTEDRVERDISELKRKGILKRVGGENGYWEVESDYTQDREQGTEISSEVPWIPRINGRGIEECWGIKLDYMQSRVLGIIQRDPEIAQRDIAKIIGVNIRSVMKAISKLREKGILERIGGEDIGYWKVGLNYIQGQVLKAIQRNPNATQHDIAKIVGVGVKNVAKIMLELKEEGILRRIGGVRGFWGIKLDCTQNHNTRQGTKTEEGYKTEHGQILKSMQDNLGTIQALRNVQESLSTAIQQISSAMQQGIEKIAKIK